MRWIALNVLQSLIHWIAVYPLAGVICPLYIRAQAFFSFRTLSMECRKTEGKRHSQSQQSLTSPRAMNNCWKQKKLSHGNPRKLKVDTHQWSLARKNTDNQVAIGFSFASDWLRRWRSFRNKSVMKQTDEILGLFWCSRKNCVKIPFIADSTRWNSTKMRTDSSSGWTPWGNWQKKMRVENVERTHKPFFYRLGAGGGAWRIWAMSW